MQFQDGKLTGLRVRGHAQRVFLVRRSLAVAWTHQESDPVWIGAQKCREHVRRCDLAVRLRAETEGTA